MVIALLGQVLAGHRVLPGHQVLPISHLWASGFREGQAGLVQAQNMEGVTGHRASARGKEGEQSQEKRQPTSWTLKTIHVYKAPSVLVCPHRAPWVNEEGVHIQFPMLCF